MSIDFLSTQKIKSTRRERTCKLCRTKILTGEPCEKLTQIHKNKFYYHIVCPHCSKILEYLFCEKGCREKDISQCLNKYIDGQIYELLKEIPAPSKYVQNIILKYELNKLASICDEENRQTHTERRKNGENERQIKI